MRNARDQHETRSPERIRAHYEIEKSLATRLRHASKEERRHLYGSLYDELFRRVPDHPMLGARSAETVRRDVEQQLGLLDPFLSHSTTFLEIGPGACALSFAVAQRVRQVYGVEVSSELAAKRDVPSNFAFVSTDGSSINLPAGSVDVVYSNQLMEHLHPEDALEQLQHVFRVLVRGGRYVCTTPNRLSGPWDVSMYFDRVASCFHLHEYTVGELQRMLHDTGFRQVQAFLGARGRFASVPSGMVRSVERILMRLPEELGWKLAHTTPLRLLLGMRLVAVK